MKRILVLILFSSYVTASTQETSNELLPSHVIQEKNPSDDALRQIKAIGEEVRTTIRTSRNEHEQYFNLNGNLDGFEYDFSEGLSLWRGYVMSDRELIVRQFAALQYSKLALAGFIVGVGDTSLRRTCVQLVKPDDVMWSVVPESIFFFGLWYVNLAIADYMEKNSLRDSKPSEKQLDEVKKLSLTKSTEFLKMIFEHNTNRIVRAYALKYLLDVLYVSEQYKTANDYYHILVNEYSDIEETKDALIRFNPAKAVQIGNTVPEFNAQVVKSGETISPEFLKGRYYLIQFWSTTCLPCIGEMAELHHTYETFKESNFTIVSFSLGDPIVVLERFWKDKWPMPWHNVMLTNGWKDEIAKAFEVISIPKMVFVGTDGQILENEDTLRGKKLADILGKYLDSRD